VTSLGLMTRGWLDGGLNSLSLHTRGWLGPGVAEEAQEPETRRSVSVGGASSGGARRMPTQAPGVPFDLDDLGLRIGVRTGAEISKADIYDMIALSIAEELHKLNKK
jgi:hypothetical protein